MSSYFMINMDVDDEFNLLAASIQRCAAGMRHWGMEELTLGLYKLFRWHELEGAIDTISGPQVQDIDELEEMCYWFKWAMAAYQMDRSSIAESLRINEEQIKKHVRTSAVLRPSYYIAVDNMKCCLVMAIRGTQSPTDIMTDFNPHSEKFEKGYAHSGMLGAAKWLMEEEHENLQVLLQAYPGHKFVLTGHSLGAGTASLLCIILQESFSKSGKIDVARQNVASPMMVCWGFGCPPCVDKELAQQPTTIRNIVLQDDLIARLSPTALDDLHSEISKLNWVHILGANTKMKKIVELGQTIHGTLDCIETSLGYENGHIYQQIKSYGYSSLAAAKEMIRTRLTEYQRRTSSSTTQSAFDWLSYGASTIIHCADMLTTSNVNHLEAGDAAIIMANAATIPINSPSSADVRLYIPGSLYHVICKDNPKHVQHIPLTHRSSRSNANNEEFTEEEVANKDVGIPSNSPSSRGNYHNQNESNTANAPPLRCVVIKGDDPALRFTRIVLSNSMLLDHRCQSYQSALEAAIDFARYVTKSHGNRETYFIT